MKLSIALLVTVFWLFFPAAGVLADVVVDAHAMAAQHTEISPESKPALSARQVAQSPIFAGAQIRLRYEFVEPPQQGRSTRLTLIFQLPVQQPLLLSFSENNDIELFGDAQRLVEGSDSGIVSTEIQFTPHSAGKHYLKFVASSADTGGADAANADNRGMRAFVIPIAVADSRGVVPVLEKERRSRIDLPSNPH